MPRTFAATSQKSPNSGSASTCRGGAASRDARREPLALTLARLLTCRAARASAASEASRSTPPTWALARPSAWMSSWSRLLRISGDRRRRAHSSPGVTPSRESPHEPAVYREARLAGAAAVRPRVRRSTSGAASARRFRLRRCRPDSGVDLIPQEQPAPPELVRGDHASTRELQHRGMREV